MFLNAEGQVLVASSACSWIKWGRGDKISWHFLLEWLAFWSLTPGPSPNGEGCNHRDTPVCPPYDSYVFSFYQQAKRGNLTYYSPLHSERGWGWGLCEFCMPEAFCEFETVRKWVLLNLWVLWEKNLTSNLFACYLIESVLSFSHRRTQHKMTCERLTCRILVANPTESISSLLVAESRQTGIKQQSTSSFMVLLRWASWQ